MGLAKSTIRTIRDKKEDIKTYLQSAAPLNVSRLTRQKNWIMEKMKELLIIWIEDNNKWRMPTSQMTIQEKALSIFENLKNGDTDETAEDVTFQASRGWFEKFRNRFNLHNLKMKGEAASANEAASKEYPNILKGIIERGGYKPEQVFNVDETGLYWKRMPDRTYISKTKKSAPGYKVSKERLTLLLGANATGDFKLKPLLTYLCENPRPLKRINKNQLPVLWRSNKKAWMTKATFEDWFKNHFCTEVKKYLRDNNLSNKALLILDNAPGHPTNLSELSKDVMIEYLPKNTTALIQPMDRGAIATFKAYYLRQTFRQLIKETNGKSSIKTFWKNYNIKDAVDSISESWKELKLTTINHVWKKIWPERVKSTDAEVNFLPEIRQNILDLAHDLGFEGLNERDVVDLLEADREPLSHEELIQLQAEPAFDEETEPVVSKQLTSKNLSKAFSYFEQGINILLEKRS
ncbi:tigger transposable element-derived protein 1-like [Centruroides vittatus]|uniref:tigger transposable element-derived protein 1-like n=1 Tax=Centruroides vittatus TaxID=120091 RepID=UPI003510789F